MELIKIGDTAVSEQKVVETTPIKSLTEAQYKKLMSLEVADIAILGTHLQKIETNELNATSEQTLLLTERYDTLEKQL